MSLNFIRRLLCTHVWAFKRNIYGDEIIENGGNRSLWECGVCGAYKPKPELVPPLTPTVCRHEWPQDEYGVDLLGACTKCGMSFQRHINTEMP